MESVVGEGEEEDMEVEDDGGQLRKGSMSRTPRSNDVVKKGVWAEQRDDMELDEEENEKLAQGVSGLCMLAISDDKLIGADLCWCGGGGGDEGAEERR